MVDLVALEARSQPTGRDETAGSAGRRPDPIRGVVA
jgi:hypothetical protein